MTKHIREKCPGISRQRFRKGGNLAWEELTPLLPDFFLFCYYLFTLFASTLSGVIRILKVLKLCEIWCELIELC